MCILNLQCSVRYNLAYVTSTLQLPQQFSLLSWHLSLLMPPWAFPSFFQAHQFHHDPLFFEQSHLSAIQEKKKKTLCLHLQTLSEYHLIPFHLWSTSRQRQPCEHFESKNFFFRTGMNYNVFMHFLSLFFFPIFWPKFPWEISLEFFYYSDMKCLTPVKKTCFDGNAFSWNSSKTSTLIAADF